MRREGADDVTRGAIISMRLSIEMLVAHARLVTIVSLLEVTSAANTRVGEE